MVLVAYTLVGCGSGKIGPARASDPARDGDPTGSGETPIDPGEPLFTHASVGTRCVGGDLTEWLVLSRDPVDCAQHADFALPESDAFLRMPLSAQPSGAQRATVPFCPPGGACSDREVTVDVSSFSPTGSLVGSWSATVGGQLIGGSVDASRCNYEPLDNPARSIRVSDVVVNQGVAVALSQNGNPIEVDDRNAPVVSGRDAVVQIGVVPEENWVRREIIAEVRIGDAVVGETRATIDGASNPSDPETMINVPVSGAQVTQGAPYSIGLFELASCVDQPGGILTPRFPETGTAELSAQALAGPLRIVLVPVRWNTDGSGRTPDLSAAVVDEFADRVQGLYPVSGVDVSVRNQAFDYDGDLDADGNGWTQLLNECLNLRASDDGPNEVYYYCVFQPTADVRDFCSGGCVAGIGPVPSASDTYRRAAIGISFDGSGIGTFVHEIGHALGRPHAPCGGANGADPAYPYNDAMIGVWGYDLVGNSHIPPDYRDMMSYCGPNWISDYNYALLFDRIESVYGQIALKSLTNLAPVTYRTVIVDADMSLSWGRPVTLRAAPEGQSLIADLLDASGQLIGNEAATYQPVTHIAGGVILIEDTGITRVMVRIPGFGVLGQEM